MIANTHDPIAEPGMIPIDTMTGDTGQSAQARPVKLTRREIEILTLAGEGSPDKEIAWDLYISTRTVNFHLRNAYAKLGMHGRILAYREAMRRGLITTPNGA